ncbi:MAG: polyprenyl diphosphate synthase [bacterium]|nr:polyprenyl diphosphate synthase [bacterium]MDZ4231829.1 polyprenyl diphosphate synthase [Candidatus Pacearchaeota archaeon]
MKNKEERSSVPRHIVLFPDGNRRWARERGLDTLKGHKAGYENLLKFREWCQERGVKALTAFGFSTENWNRTEKEVSYLMKLLETGLVRHFKRYLKEEELKRLGVRVRVIGQIDRLPKSLQKVISEVEEGTKGNDTFFLNLAISYGGRWDIVQAAQRAMREGVSPDELTEERFASYLSTSGLPDPDLVIRAGGEMRFSNFVLWQAAYAELFFEPKYWPDFTEEDLDRVLAEYARRQRRFGE